MEEEQWPNTRRRKEAENNKWPCAVLPVLLAIFLKNQISAHADGYAPPPLLTAVMIVSVSGPDFSLGELYSKCPGFKLTESNKRSWNIICPHL